MKKKSLSTTSAEHSESNDVYERVGKHIAKTIKHLPKTYMPYDPVTKCLTKPPEWDDAMWEGFVLG
jgi:hypothetical protein